VPAWFALVSACLVSAFGAVAQVRLRSSRPRALRLNAVGLTFGGAGSAVRALPAVAGGSGTLQNAAATVGDLLVLIALVLILRWLRLSYTGRHPAVGP